MDMIKTLIAKAREQGVKSGKGIAGIPDCSAVAKAFGLKDTDVESIKNAAAVLLEKYPQAATAPEWDQQTWDQFAGLIAKEIAPPPAPKKATSLFGAAEQPTQAAPQAQPDQKPAPAASLKATVLLAARRIKAANPESFELYGLNQRSLEQLVKEAESRFTNGFTRESVEAFVKQKMEAASGYREAKASIYEEAESRGWTIAPGAKKNQPAVPAVPTDYSARRIGNADLAALMQAVQFDGLSAAEAFDALGFTTEGQKKARPAQAEAGGLFGD